MKRTENFSSNHITLFPSVYPYVSVPRLILPPFRTSPPTSFPPPYSPSSLLRSLFPYPKSSSSLLPTLLFCISFFSLPLLISPFLYSSLFLQAPPSPLISPIIPSPSPSPHVTPPGLPRFQRRCLSPTLLSGQFLFSAVPLRRRPVRENPFHLASQLLCQYPKKPVQSAQQCRFLSN